MREDPRAARRLESLWSGEFGDSYTERNIASGEGRGVFWARILREFPASSVLEVGSNIGANLRWINAGRVVGVDINLGALTELRSRLPGTLAVQAGARALPFRNGTFDLVFTAGVLIHQPPASLERVMTEIVRCARRYVLCAEYFSEQPVEVPYRGQAGALFKRDFGDLYQRLFPGLALRATGSLTRSEGWDDVTFWVFERSE